MRISTVFLPTSMYCGILTIALAYLGHGLSLTNQKWQRLSKPVLSSLINQNNNQGMSFPSSFQVITAAYFGAFVKTLPAYSAEIGSKDLAVIVDDHPDSLNVDTLPSFFMVFTNMSISHFVNDIYRIITSKAFYHQVVWIAYASLLILYMMNFLILLSRVFLPDLMPYTDVIDMFEKLFERLSKKQNKIMNDKRIEELNLEEAYRMLAEGKRKQQQNWYKEYLTVGNLKDVASKMTEKRNIEKAYQMLADGKRKREKVEAEEAKEAKEKRRVEDAYMKLGMDKSNIKMSTKLNTFKPINLLTFSDDYIYVFVTGILLLLAVIMLR